MKENSSSVGTLGIVQIVLVIAKVFNFWHASWFIVLIPLWIELGIIALILLTYLIAPLLVKFFMKWVK